MTTSTLNPIISDDLKTILAQPLPWETLAGQTVLVTGSAGFLPGYLVETILCRNDEFGGEPAVVVALARSAGALEERFGHHAPRTDLRYLVQDAADPVPPDLHVDVVIHAASQASPVHYLKDPIGTLAVNVTGTERLLRHASVCKASRFLYLSSGEVYGQVPADNQPLREDQVGAVDPTDPRSCYAEGKRAGEAFCSAYWAQLGVPAVIARIFHTYGPGLKPDNGRVFADFITSVAAGRDIVMASDGSAMRAYCYVADTVAGLFTTMFHGEPGTAYNVGNEQAEVSVSGLAEMLTGAYPEIGLRRQTPPPGYVPSALSRSCPDTSRLRGLGWRPTRGLLDGFQRAIEGSRA